MFGFYAVMAYWQYISCLSGATTICWHLLTREFSVAFTHVSAVVGKCMFVALVRVDGPFALERSHPVVFVYLQLHWIRQQDLVCMYQHWSVYPIPSNM
jgi:hypothetical protein